MIKMDAVSLINLRSGTACAGEAAASRAALPRKPAVRLTNMELGPGWGRGRAHHWYNQPIILSHKEKDQSGAGVTFWCFMKAVN